MDQKMLQKLRDYFAEEESVSLAFLYGSRSREMGTEESDLDIAVYLQNPNEEDRIWRGLTKLLQQEIDLVPLNQAPAPLISAVFKTGIPLTIKNRPLYWRLFLEKTLEAEDFEEFTRSYWKISQRSHSISPEDKIRLRQRLEFLENELTEIHRFQPLAQKEYENDRPKRREVERWAENIINATIDVAKIILASEKKSIPKTYEETLEQCALMADLNQKEAEHFATFARLRNLLAHEYLDLLYNRIRQFIDEFPALYKKLSSFLKKYISKE